MTVKVSWVDDAKTAILRVFEGQWTWDEFNKSQHEAIDMLSSVQYEVPQIFDFSNATVIPSDALSHIRDSAKDMPNNRGASIVVSTNKFYGQMYNVLDKVFPRLTRKVVIVKTREEAIEKAHETVTQK
jgi:hypothetical protein